MKDKKKKRKKGWNESIEYIRVQTEALKIKIATVHKISSEDYERDSLRVLVTAIKRYLTEKVSKRSICHNRKLISCLVFKELFAFKDHYCFKMFEQI